MHEDILRVVMPWAQQPIRYNKCFISYASEDKDFVSQLRDQLVNSGVDRTFVANRSLKPGDRYVDVIRNEIASSGCVIVVVSRHSILSDWVAREVGMAFEGERPGGPATVIPLTLISQNEWEDATVPWARHLRESFHAINYWTAREDGRQEAFRQLLSALLDNSPTEGAASPGPSEVLPGAAEV